MLDDYGFEVYEENTFPIAYLLTFRTFGSWLHGDDRGSIERSRNNRFKTIRRDVNVPLKDKMMSALNQHAVNLSDGQRKLVSRAIEEVCKHRKYDLHALNVRSNHAHAV